MLRRFQFSLKTLFWLMAAVAAFFAFGAPLIRVARFLSLEKQEHDRFFWMVGGGDHPDFWSNLMPSLIKAATLAVLFVFFVLFRPSKARNRIGKRIP
jgi:hypothetical protein